MTDDTLPSWLNEQLDKPKKSNNDFNKNPSEDTSKVTENVTNEYEKLQKELVSRKAIEKVHPYVSHIELFLGLIAPAYAAELVLADDNEGFTVSDSKVNFLWQLNDDLKHNALAAKAYYGPLAKVYEKFLFPYNNLGIAVNVAINEFRSNKRHKAEVTACRAVWIEDDTQRSQAQGPKTDFPIAPSFVVESSSKKFHYYWLTYTEDLKAWEYFQKEIMVKKFASDEGANGLNRAMRVPGFWHKKARPFATRIVQITKKNGTFAQPDEKLIEQLINHGVDLNSLPGHKKGERGQAFAFALNNIAEVVRYDWAVLQDRFSAHPPEVDYIEAKNASHEKEYDPNDVIDKILSSEDFHGSLHSLCMHFANTNQNEAYVTSIVQGLMQRVPESQRDDRWTSRYKDIARSAKAAVTLKLKELLEEEKFVQDNTIDISRLKRSIELDEDPQGTQATDWILPFPDMSGACAPLDLLMGDFKRSIPGNLPAFNYAAILSLFSLILQKVPLMYMTYSKPAVTSSLLLAPSTGGKDANTRNPIRDIVKQILDSNLLSHTDLRSNLLLGTFLIPTPRITSLTGFLQWASSEVNSAGAIWLDTEATKIIQDMSSDNSGIAALSDVIIQNNDGLPISGASKADKQIPAAKEAFPILWATQPDVVRSHMTPILLQQGVFGRLDYYIPDRPLENEVESTLLPTQIRPTIVQPNTIRFLAYAITVISAHVTRIEANQNTSLRTKKFLFDDGYDYMHTVDYGENAKYVDDWFNDHARQYFDEDEDKHLFLRRVTMSLERVQTIFAFMNRLYEGFLNQEDQPLDITPLLTLDQVAASVKHADYQYKVRSEYIWHMMKSDKGLDSECSNVLLAVKRAIVEPNWLDKEYGKNKAALMHCHKNGLVPLRAVVKKIKGGGAQTSTIESHIRTLDSLGYVQFYPIKQIEPTIYSRPLKKMVLLTAQGAS